MSPAKAKAKSLFPALLGKFFSLLISPGRRVFIVALLVGGFLLGWHFVWRDVREHVLSANDYLVTAEKVDITPLPTWIHADIRAEAFRNASLDGPLSLLDDNLAERIATAFSLHPWIAKVLQVTKQHPARVRVALDYRRPVLMVEVPGGLLPVDARGVLLPAGDFSAVEKSRFPRLVGVETVPLGTAGEGWGEARVVGAAELAAALGAAWDDWKLTRIIPYTTTTAGGADDIAYVLMTRGGTRIVWGSAPSHKVAGELSAEEKIAALKQYAAAYGSLEGRDGPQELDVRNPRLDKRQPL